MDPLSAFRAMATPEWRALPQLPSNSEASAPGAIPFQELEGLKPAFTPSALTAPPPSISQGNSFENLLKGFTQEVAAKQGDARDSVRGLLSGQNVSLHQTMITMEEASIAFQLMVEVRNKLLESYQELMRMQV